MKIVTKTHWFWFGIYKRKVNFLKHTVFSKEKVKLQIRKRKYNMRYLPDILLYGNEKEITKITNLRGDLLSAIFFFLKEILYFMIMLQLQEQNKLKKKKKLNSNRWIVFSLSIYFIVELFKFHIFFMEGKEIYQKKKKLYSTFCFSYIYNIEETTTIFLIKFMWKI